ncbi:MAG: YihY/virulence factor BrkB family protein [Planctomycetaceae bacterium]|nr:YihY/virulence factor BrkB family protein [Planctomycetales bacterium]MCB9927714.1 YihY/virulence factor BrkB family protein [Planctomycetaceae bacterium]
MTAQSVTWAFLRYFWGVLINLLEASRRWQRDDAGLLAACVAYYATISLFPLLMVLIAGLGVFLKFTSVGQSSEEFVLTVIAQETTQDVAMQVNAAFQQIEHQALLSGPLAMVGLVAAAMAVFAQFDRAFDKIWKIDAPMFDGYVSAARREIAHRLKAFVVLLSLGCVVALFFFASMALDAVIHFSSERFHITPYVWRITKVMLSIGLNAFVFTAVYKCLSKIPVGWLHAARGGLLAAATWELGRLILATYFTMSKYDAYGIVGALLAAMLWAYYASSVLFLGAEYVQVIREQAIRSRREESFHRAIAQQTQFRHRLRRIRPRAVVRRAA